jgi:hypothetical protein
MRILSLLFLTFCISCSQANSQKPFFPISNDNSLTSPSFTFEYGQAESLEPKNKSWLEKFEGSICVYSLPSYLYFRETGAKFNVCLPVSKEVAESIALGFENLDLGQEYRTLFHVEGHQFELNETTFAKWEKSNLGRIPIESFHDRKTLDSTIAYARFAVPQASFFQWDTNSCEVIFPSRAIANTKNSWKMIQLTFVCPEISIKEDIIEQNQKWLKECVSKPLTYSESFRHSDSPFGRFLEWSNDSLEIVCPAYDELSFADTNTGKRLFLDANDFESLRSIHKIMLPDSVLIFRTAEQLSGIRTSEELLASIGKAGTWNFTGQTILESPYNFKQGEEFYSVQREGVSCRDQLKFQSMSQDSCLNPGLPNGLKIEGATSQEHVKSCKTSDLRISEYFSGTTSPQSIPIFLEIQNIGSACDLSNIILSYENEIFPLASSEKLLLAGEIFIVSTKRWEGWPFQTIVKPFSTREFKFVPPRLSLKEKDTSVEKKINSIPNQFFLTNENGITNRSLLFREDQTILPHPNLKPEEDVMRLGVQASPGFNSTNQDFSFLSIPISEVLLAGTKDNQASYPERFIEWADSGVREGFLYFEILSSKRERFLYYKEKNISYPIFKNGSGLCLPTSGALLPDSSLPNEDMRISLLDSFGNYQIGNELFSFNYTTNVFSEFGFSSLTRRSVHPERLPFKNSLSGVDAFSPPCSPNSESSPARINKKVNQILPITSISGIEAPSVGSYSFLFSPSTSAIFRYRSENKTQSLSSPSVYPPNFEWDLSLVPLETQFLEREMVFLDWIDPQNPSTVTMIQKLGEVQIEAVYPTPPNSQNEWLYFCNKTNKTISTLGYIIQDDTNTDLLVPYSVRFPSLTPSFRFGAMLKTNEANMEPGICAFVVDPDGSNWYLPPFAKSSDILLTVNQTQTIGNGIASDERLDIFVMNGSERVHLSTYGKKNSGTSFQIPLKGKEFSFLIKNRFGNFASDFQVYTEIE